MVERVTNDPMEAHYIGFNMGKAVEKVKTTDVDTVTKAMYGIKFPNPMAVCRNVTKSSPF